MSNTNMQPKTSMNYETKAKSLVPSPPTNLPTAPTGTSPASTSDSKTGDLSIVPASIAYQPTPSKVAGQIVPLPVANAKKMRHSPTCFAIAHPTCLPSLPATIRL
ncbi:Hypothetical predicted protein [Paramuricea clavata]|uniref:Uncharacterized protein n=1 Tax=Paramuricea clavata TaxID=317549 RepID=A0A7D9ISV4_PARCT|nr:Hypothetical predicted protein [Paramuricea clavata]